MLKLVLKNDRVMKILDLIDKFKVCDITHVQRLFYHNCKQSYVKAQAKMTALVKEKTLSRRRNDINSKYYYFTGKPPAQVQHKLLLTELYVRLCEIYSENNVECTPEYTGIPGIRPDAYIRVTINRRVYLYFIEIYISNNPIDIAKYERAYQTKVFPGGIFPTVVIVTDKKVNVSSRHLNIVILDTNMDIGRMGLDEKIKAI